MSLHRAWIVTMVMNIAIYDSYYKWKRSTSFPGFSPTRPTERERETLSLSLSRSVGRVGENPGNEVGKRFEKIVSKALYYIV